MSVSARLALPKPLMRWWAEDARRDLRIDMLRGLFVVAMVADHTASGTVLNRITGGGHRIFSAAEGFILLSGGTVGFVYPRVVARGGLRHAARRLLRRAGIIYAVGVTAGILSTAFILLRASRMGAFPDQVVEVLTFRHPYGEGALGLESILLLYAVLFLLAPVTVALLHLRKTPALLALAAAAWLVQEYARLGYTNPGPDGWSRDIGGLNTRFALLQVWAVWATFAALAWHRHRLAPLLARIPTAAWFVGSGAALALCSAAFSSGDVSHVLLEPEKLLVCAVTFVFLLSAVTLFESVLVDRAGWLFVPLGQQALVAVGIHIVLLSIPLFPFAVLGPLEGIALQICTIAAVWLVTQLWVGVARSESAPVGVARAGPTGIGTR